MLYTTLMIVAGVIAFIVILLLSMYVKATPSTAYIISGLSKEPRYLIGKGGFVIPFLERKDTLTLSQITLDVNTKEPVPTKDFINVNIDAVAIIQVSKQGIQLAAKNYINKNAKDIGLSVVQTISGCLREAIGTVEFKELNLNRDAFSKTVMQNVTTDIQHLGLEILSCNIERVDDGNGLIDSLGADNTWKIKKEAANTAAEADRSIRETKADAERQAKEAEIKAQELIAVRENSFELKRAELKKTADKNNAEADAVYKIGQAEQQAIINTKLVDADIAKTIREQELSKQKIAITENTLKSTINAEADAEKYQKSVNADANQYQKTKEAEVALIQAQRAAEAKKAQAAADAEAVRLMGLAQAEAKKAQAEAEAETIRQTGAAEAEAIKAKGLAEAEALNAKAEAYEKFGNAAIIDMVVKILPEMAANVAAPISSIDSVKIYGSDGNGISTVSGNVPSVLAQTFDTLESVGVPVKEMLEAKTKAAVTDRNISVDGLKPLHS